MSVSVPYNPAYVHYHYKLVVWLPFIIGDNLVVFTQTREQTFASMKQGERTILKNTLWTRI